jgi:hypothetical protein
MNKAAIRFCKSLFAAFGRWKTPEETKEVYTEKLSKWHLSDEAWSRALSEIISDHPDGDLPALGAIYPYLKRIKDQVALSSDWATQLFTLHGFRVARRVWNDYGTWRVGRIVFADSKRKWRLEKSDAVALLPAGATDERIQPDNEVLMEESEKCQMEEAQKIFCDEYIKAGGKPKRLQEFFEVVHQLGD